MPLQATSGAASYDAFGGGVAAEPNYIESCFSTYLYTGNGSTTTINNGIDVSGEGGLVWVKARGNGNRSHTLFDSATYTTGQYYLATNITNGFLDTGVAGTFALNNNGFSVAGTSAQWNASGELFSSWTFRKQPKFFDVVTFSTTTSSSVPITVNHNLGSVPGCIIVKQTNGAADWFVYHRSLGSSQYLALNSTDQSQNGGTSKWYSTPTSTSFTLGGDFVQNATYVAYLFAHNAGGFGLTGTDNVITCGSFTTSGSGQPNATINLGYEPQWIMYKRSNGTGEWRMQDNMRGLLGSWTGYSRYLVANTSAAEDQNAVISITPTGFLADTGTDAQTYIYIAIRRGPMKVPTDGTSVFSPTLVTGNGTNDRQITGVGFPPDLLIGKTMGTVLQPLWYDKLRGKGKWLESSNTLAEQTLGGGSEGLMLQDGFVVDNNWGSLNINTRTYVDWMFRRAPSFFDEVCYTGTGSATTQTHNLGVVPEFMIVKVRGSTGINWSCYHSALGNTQVISLNEDIQAYTSTQWNNTTPTSTVFSVGTQDNVNGSAKTYVAYLFATCAGVSKVGSYTGTGTTLQINCGFTSGSRFVLIKRTDEVASGNPWYVWDSARGIVSGNDPYLLLNSTAAEVTNTDYVDTYSAGFEISSTAPAAINASGGTFIFLAIA